MAKNKCKTKKKPAAVKENVQQKTNNKCGTKKKKK